jgi:hypothetical protein
MAGTRNSIAWWRRIEHLSLMLCVQSVVLLALLCAVGVDVQTSGGLKLRVRGASVSITVFTKAAKSAYPLTESSATAALEWHAPKWLPRRNAMGGPFLSPIYLVPLWPVPVVLGGVAAAARWRTVVRRQPDDNTSRDSMRRIARWRRTRHAAELLALQTLLMCVVSCALRVRVMHPPDVMISLTQAGIECSRVSPQLRKWIPSFTSAHAGSPAWQAPKWLPVYDAVPNFVTNTRIFLPFWPLPVAFGALAWYAGRRIKQLRPHVCATCGYDTRGLAAGACCPECGTVQAA